jgi:uncharacterized protein (TIGR02452 family)
MNNEKDRLSRLICWKETIRVCNNYISPPPLSIKHVNNGEYNINKRYNSNSNSTCITIRNMDTLDCALMMQCKCNPVILNLANNRVPGGGIDNGCEAQEESIFRRTNYFKTLTPDLYPIRYNEIIYSSNVSIIRSSESSGWRYIQTPIKMSFIACPGIYNPILTNDGNFTKEDYIILKHKIKHILYVAYTYGHDNIILGALGCGAWRNPPEQVASIFKEVINEFSGVFKNIEFAITGNNFHIFNNVFSK